MRISPEEYERIPAYRVEDSGSPEYVRFLEESGNTNFRKSTFTYLSLAVLMLGYPALSLLSGVDPSQLKMLEDKTLQMLTLVGTVFIQWTMFLLLFVAVFREQTGLGGLGLKKLRWLDLAWAVAFLLGANTLLFGLAFLLAQVGLPMPGEIAWLIPTDPWGRIVWIVVSFTAGFCEEIAFRGYLMTRLRILGRTRRWIVPTIISAVVFGTLHAYQGIPGLIMLTVYGALISLLYLRTGSLWPCIIAHALQDLGALFFPQ